MIVHYLCGSRADFGLMRECLSVLQAASEIDLQIVVTGQATVARYGNVEAEIAAAGLPIGYRLPVTLSGADGAEMAVAMAEELAGLTRHWSSERPDLVLLLGDRGEMLAAALAAYHLEIPIGHLHGGERSGTLDEGFRHAISKLATWHFPASADAADRLKKMGERDEDIKVVGAPGLVEVAKTARPPADWLAKRFGFTPDRLTALMLFHPVVQEREGAYAQTRAIIDALTEYDAQAIVLRPNSDAGGAEIDRCLSEVADNGSFLVLSHLERNEFLAAVAAADVMIGNSSAGIIESASLGTPCVNLGSRQQDRLRNDNVVDCPGFVVDAIRAAMAKALELKGPFLNLYGQGDTDRRLRAAIAGLPAMASAPKKRNSY